MAEQFQVWGGRDAAEAKKDAAQYLDSALRAEALARKVKNALHPMLRGGSAILVSPRVTLAEALSQGRVEEAERLLQTATELAYKGSGTDAQEAAASNKQALAMICQQLGRYRDAEALFLEVRCPHEVRFRFGQAAAQPGKALALHAGLRRHMTGWCCCMMRVFALPDPSRPHFD